MPPRKNRPSTTSAKCSQNVSREYDIVYTNKKVVKGKALAEQLAHHPLSYEFPNEQIMSAKDVRLEADSDEWKLWFDGAMNMLGNGIRALLASLEDQYFPFSAKLGFDCTNNMAKYEACAMAITMAIEHQVKRLKVFGDLVLVIYQLRGE
ncbi:hypothetical protein CR513_39003, partial [Mucuna pruriens]